MVCTRFPMDESQREKSMPKSIINLQLQKSKSLKKTISNKTLSKVLLFISKMFILIQKIMIFLLIMYGILEKCQCQSSLPYSYQPLPNIESGTFLQYLALLDMTISGEYVDAYTYNFLKVKRSQPLPERTFVAIKEMDYNINKFTGVGIYSLYFEVSYTLSGTSSMQITFSSKQNMVNKVTISLIIFDNDFAVFDEAFQDIGYISFSSGVINVQSFTTKSTSYEIVRFLTSIDVTTIDNSITNQNIAQNTITKSSIAPTLQIETNLTGNNINSGNGQLRVLLVYPSLANNYGYTVVATKYLFSTAPFAFTYNIAHYNESRSVFFMGLDRFEYTMTADPLNTGFQWNVSISQGPSNSMIIETVFDDQVSLSLHFYLLISMIRCPIGFDFIGTNRTTGLQECFQTCYQNEYVEYDATNEYYICTQCSDSLCKTCDNPTQCSSCIDGFTLVETSQTCIPMDGFYLDVNSVLRPCSYNLVGCLNCTVDGGTCNRCEEGYYLSGSQCISCSANFPECSNCNDTSCLDCLAPKVLINGTLCSQPITPQNITPSNPRGPCTDPNCFECSETDASQCVVCKSNIYILQDGKCNTVCGDGLIDGTDVCDDSNTIDFDGCSADCQTLQEGFICNNVPALLAGYQSTQCYFGQVINLSVVSIQKTINENKVNLYFNNPHPKINAWQQIDRHNELTQAFTLSIPRFDSGVPGYFFNYTASFVKSPDLISKLRVRSNSLSPDELYSQTAQTRLLQSSVFTPEHYEFIMLEVSYLPDAPGSAGQPHIDKESLNHQTMAISFDPKLSQRTIFTKGAAPLLFSSSFKLKADDNQVIQFYDESYYEKVGQIEALSMVIGFSCLLLMVIGLASFCVDGRNSKQMLVAVETAFVVQLSYFSLLGVGETNPLLLSMGLGLKYSTGYDPMLEKEGSQTLRYLLSIDVGSVGMASNVNISFILVFVLVLLGGVLLLLDKFVFSKKTPQKYTSSSKALTNQPNAMAQEQFQSEKKQNNQDDHQSYKSQKSHKGNNNQNIDKNEPIEKSEGNEQNSLNQNKEDPNQDEESKYHKFGMFLIFNAGFGFFLFYLYKWAFFTFVQIKYGMSQIGGANVLILGGCIVLLILFIVLLVRKLKQFQTLTLKLTGRKYKINTFDTLVKNKDIPKNKLKNIQKRFAVYIENLPSDEKPEILRNNSLQGPSINIKLWYFVVIIIEHLLNVAVIVFMSSSFIYVNMIPTINYVLIFILLYKIPVYPSSNLYRLYSAQFVGMIVQAIFLTRRILSVSITADSAIGKEQNSLSMYLTITVVILLLLLCLESFAFSLYGIKKIRCCELQMNWENIEMNHQLKQKLQNFVIQEIADDFNAKIKTNHQKVKEVNSDLDDEQNDGQYDNLPFINKNSSFDSSDDQPYFNSPSKFNKFKEDKDNVSIAQSPAFNGRKLMKKPMKNMIDFDRPINQEITTQLLKKQIKEKLLNSRLQNKIKRMGGFDDQKSHRSKKGHDSVKSQGRANSSMIVSSNSRNKILVSNVTEEKGKIPNVNAKKIKEVDFMNSILLKNEILPKQKVNEEEYQEIGYVYTDKKGYDVYEQFDII